MAIDIGEGLLSYNDVWKAVRDNFEARPEMAQACHLVGNDLTVYPGGEKPRPGLLWIMGFNNGESGKNLDRQGRDWSTRHWLNLCEEAAQKVGSPGWVLRERVFWGSPTVGELNRRVGSRRGVEELLRLHASVNLLLLQKYRPLVVWLTGICTYLPETIKSYHLISVGVGENRESGRGRLWQAYIDDQGVPWLATLHPSARPRHSERARILEKLAELSKAHSTKVPTMTSSLTIPSASLSHSGQGV